MRTEATIAAAPPTAGPAAARWMPAPEEAQVHSAILSDGAAATSSVTAMSGLRGKGVPAADMEREGMSGHHHLLINRAAFGEGETGAGEPEPPVMNDDDHLHFGGGQTAAVLDLPSGAHTLQLVLRDRGHVPQDPPVMSEVITITVTEQARPAQGGGWRGAAREKPCIFIVML
jgi:hypothetical protein